jgi:hypothetical protein
MLRRVALVRTDVSEELSASIIRVTRVGELGTLAVTSNRCSSETSVLTRATRRNIPEDAILLSTEPCCSAENSCLVSDMSHLSGLGVEITLL